MSSSLRPTKMNNFIKLTYSWADGLAASLSNERLIKKGSTSEKILTQTRKREKQTVHYHNSYLNQLNF